MALETLSTPQKRSRLRRLGWAMTALVLFLFVALNAVFYCEARAMTHYAPDGIRTTRLSELRGWAWLRTVLAGPTVRRQINRQTPANVGLERV